MRVLLRLATPNRGATSGDGTGDTLQPTEDEDLSAVLIADPAEPLLPDSITPAYTGTEPIPQRFLSDAFSPKFAACFFDSNGTFKPCYEPAPDAAEAGAGAATGNVHAQLDYTLISIAEALEALHKAVVPDAQSWGIAEAQQRPLETCTPNSITPSSA